MSYGGEVVLELMNEHGYTEAAACAAVVKHGAFVRDWARQGFLSTSVATKLAMVDQAAAVGEAVPTASERSSSRRTRPPAHR